jgi:hypothetical protein
MTVYGKERLYNDLQQIGHIVDVLTDHKKIEYVVIKDYSITTGQFHGRVIDLAIPVPKDYPRTVGPCIHVKSNPILLNNIDSIKGKRNIINSSLGPEWKYWSFRFNISPENPTVDLLSQINGIFRNI